jgi:hypothetical protein
MAEVNLILTSQSLVSKDRTEMFIPRRHDIYQVNFLSVKMNIYRTR